jgi:hypothetical protein
MTTLVTADEKGRIPVRGSKPGSKYLVSSEGGEWRVTPYKAKAPRSRNSRYWSGPKGGKNLVQAIKELGEAGLTLERSEMSRQPVPPCRF